MTGRLRALVPLLLVAVLLGLAAAAAGLSSLRLPEVEREPVFDRGLPEGPEPDAGSAPPGAEPPPAADQSGADWLGEVVLLAWLVTGVAALALLVWAIARRHGRRSGSPRLRALRRSGGVAEAAADDSTPLVAALDEGLAALSDDDQDPRRAVIACWVRLAEAAAVAGVPRYPADTAGDLVVRLLRSHQVSEPVLAQLAEVYRLARYATHDVDESMRGHARAALQRLRDELPAGATLGAPA